MKTGISHRNVSAVIDKMQKVSINRSVTTVPKDCASEILSDFFNTAQRLISPILGRMRLEAYDRKMASTQLVRRGVACSGSSV